MASRQSNLGPRPMSIQDINIQAKRYEYNPRISLRTWLRTTDMLLREVGDPTFPCFTLSTVLTLMQASIYEDDGNYDQSYMLLLRYLDLVIEKLRTHPEGKLPEFRAMLKAAIKQVPAIVEKLEELKPQIVRNQEAYEARLARDQKAGQAFGGDGSIVRKSGRSDLSESDPAVAGKTRTIAAKDHGDIPVKLYKRESRRRDDVRRSGRDRRGRGYSESDRAADDDADLRRAMEDTRRRLNNSQDEASFRPRKLTKSRSPSRPFNTAPSANAYSYPSIKKSTPFTHDDRQSPYRSTPQNLPPVPSKEAFINRMSYDAFMRPPSRPEKVLRDPSPAPRAVSPLPDDLEEYTFNPSAYLENGNPLRCLFLPADLRKTFLDIASRNTRNNLETCGILCGTLMSNALFVSRLVIPEQEGSSDTCEMTNENALFEFCDTEGLMVLGWIHTHPTQSCFMSSRDLHTHCGFQVMMPEAIAIVCAPSRKPS